MANAQIKFTQGALNPPAGQALQGVTGTPVICTNGDNTNVVSWSWVMVDVPPGSAVATGTFSSSSVGSFNPDLPGGYLVRETTHDNLGNVYTDDRAVLVPEDSIYNRIIAPFMAVADALNVGGQTRGWATFMEPYLHVLDRLGDVGGSAPTNGQVPMWSAANARYEPGAISSGPSSGTGFAHYVGGAVDPAARAIDLSSSGFDGDVTGVLSAGNQADQSMAGDVTGTTGANIIAAITGIAGVVATTAALLLGASGPTYPTTGSIRTPYYAGATYLWTGMPAAATEGIIVAQVAGALGFGDTTWTTAALYGIQVSLHGDGGSSLVVGSGYNLLTNAAGNYMEAPVFTVRGVGNTFQRTMTPAAAWTDNFASTVTSVVTKFNGVTFFTQSPSGILSWGSTVTPLITQDTAGGPGGPLTIRAQGSTLAAAKGGTLNLFGGTPGAGGGYGDINIGSNGAQTAISIGYNSGVGSGSTTICGNPVSISAYDGSGALMLRGYVRIWGPSHNISDISNRHTLTFVPEAAYTMQLAELVTSFSWSWLASTVGAGGAFTISGQDAKASSGAAGGDISFQAGLGDGAGANGTIRALSAIFSVSDHGGLFPRVMTPAAAWVDNFDAAVTSVATQFAGVTKMTQKPSGLELSANLTLYSQKLTASTLAIDAGGVYACVVMVTPAVGGTTITLPTPAAGRTVFVKDATFGAASNSVTLAPHGGEKIEGLAASKTFTATGFAIMVISDGTDWFIWSC